MKPRDWVFPTVVPVITAPPRPRKIDRRRSVPEHAHPLVRRFFAIRNVLAVSDADLSKHSGVAHCTLASWKRKSPQLLTFEVVLNALGYRLAIVPTEKAEASAEQERAA